jgi:hypothetical protein
MLYLCIMLNQLNQNVMFTKEYVETILTPYVGKELRMITDKIPFCLETSMDSSFQIELTILGIKYVLINNYYIKQDLKITLNKALTSVGVYAHTLDKLKNVEGDCVVFKELVKFMEENFTPQIAFTYYTQIKTLEVSNEKFVLNGISFIICK